MAWVMLAVMLLLVGGALSGAAVLLMAWSIVHPPRMTDGKAAYVLQRLSPGDLGLDFENLSFPVPDQRTGKNIDLSAWWIPAPAPSDCTVILVHGYGDAKVGSIAWAPPWIALGVNVLALDMRAHGESGGTVCTAGFYEREDLSHVLDQLRRTRPRQTRTLILMGISLGAAMVAATAVQRTDLDGVVLDSPIGNFATGAATLARATGAALPSLMPAAVWLAGRMLRADFHAVSPLVTIAQIRSPLLLIQSGDDFLVPPPVRERLRDAAGAENTWEVAGCAHTGAVLKDGPAYVQHLAQLLSRARIPARH